MEQATLLPGSAHFGHMTTVHKDTVQLGSQEPIPNMTGSDVRWREHRAIICAGW